MYGRSRRRVIRRLALVVCFALAATFTGSVGLFSASAQVIAPSAGSTAASSSALPVCPPGQEATTVAGSGTPAPLGNLQNVPAGVAGGGTFAGVALDAEQVKMAATVAAVGKQMGITRRGIEIGIAVATEQSSLRPDAVNEAWLGLFQQNPVDYTMYPRTEPGGAAWMFYDRLLRLVPGYDTDPRTDYQIGDVVQLTGTGERFGQYQDMARDLAGQLIDSVSLAQDDVTCVPAPASPATTSGSGFDPGNIISDAVFYNTGAMTQAQIRQFVLTQGEGCTAAYCLKNLRVSTPSQPADRYCAAYQGGANEDVAAVLLRVSVACGINPQVMLVTLQKESALLTRTDVSASTYNAAWGWHCPDTGPGGSANCDPAYAGFFNQAYGMAKQWSRYKLDPDRYNYHAGQTVNILWNVAESGCGSAPVTIANQATASLYIYTPYQPNAASLAAYPGVGDACSAYGNRNFFYLFRKYFGSTGGGSSTTATSAVLATGTAVKIPANQFVSAALGGQTITAPNAAVAAGLAAGFSALGLPYVWGGGGSGAGPNNGCAPWRRRVQQLRQHDRVRLLGVDGVRAGQGRVPDPGQLRIAAVRRGHGELGAGAARRRRGLPRPRRDLPGHLRRAAVHPGGVLGRHADPHRAVDPHRRRRPALPVLDRSGRRGARRRGLLLADPGPAGLPPDPPADRPACRGCRSRRGARPEPPAGPHR